MTALLRSRQMSRRTEEAYLMWCRQFVEFHGNRPPGRMGDQRLPQSSGQRPGHFGQHTKPGLVGVDLSLSRSAGPRSGRADRLDASPPASPRADRALQV
ncbi:MAG: phage integrase N-terminal SAM-like domain-containing protein [Opitutae bacterium]|nr:phage integrase N-terminal SAM-like domain-containing protein [Opitutae bacterium]